MIQFNLIAARCAGLIVCAMAGTSIAHAQITGAIEKPIEAPPVLPCKLGDEVTLTKWSGQHSGTIAELSAPNSEWHGLKNIKSLARWNESCGVEIELLRLPVDQNTNEEQDPKAERKLSRAYNNCDRDAQEEFVVGNTSEEWTNNNGRVYESLDFHYVNGVQICNDDSNKAERNAMQALRVTVAVLEPAILNKGNMLEKRTCSMRQWNPTSDRRSGVHSQGGGDATYEVPDFGPEGAHKGCSNWRRMRLCEEGSVATGIQVNENEAGISGIRLLCREVIPSWSPDALRPDPGSASPVLPKR